MATSSQMLMAGIAFVVDTFVLIYSAVVGDKIFQPIFKWYYAFNYGDIPPPIDPGLVTWIPRVYFGMLIFMWFALLLAMAWMTMNRTTYGYYGG